MCLTTIRSTVSPVVAAWIFVMDHQEGALSINQKIETFQQIIKVTQDRFVTLCDSNNRYDKDDISVSLCGSSEASQESHCSYDRACQFSVFTLMITMRTNFQCCV